MTTETNGGMLVDEVTNMSADETTLLAALFPIHPADLAIALATAQMDPDGQEYPWRAGYPLVGGSVVHDGQLWTVVGTETGPGADEMTAIVQLDGRAGAGRATRGDCRPVTWTLGQEADLAVAASRADRG